MATTKPVIIDALQELLEAGFKDFKRHLSKSGSPDKSISRGKLKKANHHDVVDLMVQQYGTSDAGKIAVTVLRKIKHNDLADQLKGKLAEVPEDLSAEGGASSGAAAVNASTARVTVTIMSNVGTVNAPVLHGGVFNGPMNFNFKS